MQDATTNPTVRAREAIEIVCSGDVTKLEEYYSSGFVDHVNDMVHHGHDGLWKSFALYSGVFDRWHFEVEEQISEGNRIVSRWTLHGICQGRDVRLAGMTLSRVDEDGRMAEDWGFTDTFALLRQLGVLRTVWLGLKVLTRRVKVPAGAG